MSFVAQQIGFTIQATLLVALMLSSNQTSWLTSNLLHDTHTCLMTCLLTCLKVYFLDHDTHIVTSLLE